MNNFGLGLVLSFTDNLSGGVNNAITSINGLISSLERVDDTASTVSLMALCSIANQVGDTFESMGSSILGVFSSVMDKTMEYGSMFEKFRITVGALYNDLDNSTGIVDEVIGKMTDFAVKSPFDMEQVMPYITKFKVLGVDAFDSVTNAMGTSSKQLIEWTTDLMSVRADLDSTWWSKAITNFLNPDNQRSLYMLRNGLGDIEGLLSSVGDTLANDVEGRVRNLTSIVTALGADGLTSSMMGTWSTLISNMEDVFMQFWLGIADGGAFDDVKSSLMGVVSALNSVDTKAFGQVIADGLKIITVPLKTIAELTAKAISGFTDFATAHPKLVKLAIGATAVVGVLFILSGMVLKIGSQFGMMAIGINVATQALGAFRTSSVINQLGGLGRRIGLVTLAVAGLYTLWVKDFAGIKTKTQTFVNNVKSSFSQAKNIIQMNANDMKVALEALDINNPFNNFTKGLVKIGVLFGAVSEGLSNRDANGNFLMSGDTYTKVLEFGLEGIVGRIFDVTYAFNQFTSGFKSGWDSISESVKKFIDGFKLGIEGTFLDDLITKVSEFASSLNFNRDEVFGFFEGMGEMAGKIAPVVLALTGLRTVFGGIGSMFGAGIGGEGIIGAISGMGGSIGTALTTAFTVGFRALNPMSFIALISTMFTNITSNVAHFATGGVISIVNSISRMLTGGRLIQGNGIASLLMKTLGDLGNPSNFGSLFETFSTMFNKSIFAPFKLLSKVVTTPFQLVGKVIGALANPFGAILAVITGIGSAFVLAYEKSDEFRQKINDLLGLKEDLDFSHIFDGLKNGLGSAWEILKESFGDILSFDWLKNGLNFGGDGGGFGSAFDSIKSKLTEFWETVQPILARLGVTFAYIAGAVWDVVGIIGNVLAIATKAIAPLLQGIVSAVMIAIDTVLGYIQGVIKVFSGVWDIISGVIVGLVGLFTGNTDLISQAGEKIKTGFSSIWEGLTEMVSSIVQGAKDWVQNFIDTGYNMVMGIWDGFVQAKDTLFSSIENFFNNMVDAVKTLLGIHSPSTVFAEIGDFIIQGLTSGIQEKIDMVIGAFLFIVNGVKQGFNNLVGFLSNIGSSIATFFTNGFQIAYDTVTSIFGSFSDFFSGIWDAVVGLFSGEMSPSTFFSTVFQEAYDLVTGIFSTLGEFFGGIWQNIVDLFSDIGTTVGEAVSNTVSKAVNAVLSTAVNIINGFISAINFAIDLINEIPGVSIGKLNSLSVPQMAEGGVVDKATLAVVGEAGKEAVMPLENNTGWIDSLASRINISNGRSPYLATLCEYVSTVATYLGVIAGRHTESVVRSADGIPVIIDTTTDTPHDDNTPMTPVVHNSSVGNSYTNTYSTGNYLTKTTNNTKSGDVDNSVVFQSGAIVIQANGCSEAEAERLATIIMKKIERKRQINNLTNYRAISEY